MTNEASANPMLLDSYLKQLRLPGFLHHWRSFAVDAANSNLSYDRFLLALAEQEVARREQNGREQRIKSAHFPVIKELADFDFTAIPKLNRSKVEITQHLWSIRFADGADFSFWRLCIRVANSCQSKTFHEFLWSDTYSGKSNPVVAWAKIRQI